MKRIKIFLIRRKVYNYKYFIIILFLFLFLFYKLYYQKLQYEAQKINSLLQQQSFSSCKQIFNLQDKVLNNRFIDKKYIEKYKQDCKKNFSLSSITLGNSICKLIVNIKNKNNLEKYFLFLDNYEKIKTNCLKKYKNLAFTKGKGLKQEYYFYLKYPEKIRYKDKFYIDLGIISVSENTSNLTIKIFNQDFNKNENVFINRAGHKKIELKLENNKLLGDINYNIDILKNTNIIFKKQVGFDILNSYLIGEQEYYFFENNYNKKITDYTFSFTGSFDKKNSNVNLLFYNNGLYKIYELLKIVKSNKIENSFYYFTLLSIYSDLLNLKDYQLEKLGFSRKNLLKEVDKIVDILNNNYKTKNNLFSLYKDKKEDNYILTSMIYSVLTKLNINDKNLEFIKNKLVEYVKNDTISLDTRLEIMYNLSLVDKNIDYRFIDIEKIKNLHSLIIFTYGLLNTGKIINNEIVKINIKKIKKELEKNNKYFNEFYSNFSDKLLFLSLLIDYNDYKNKLYLKNELKKLYNINFDLYNLIDKSIASNIFSKYNKDIKVSKTHFGYMLGAIRPHNSLWVGGKNNYFVEKKYNIGNVLISDEIKDVDLRIVILKGQSLFTNIKIDKLYTYKKFINKNVEIYREIYKKDNYGKYIKVEGELIQGEQYKIVNKISFIDKRPRKNIVIKDFLPSSFRFLQFDGKDVKYNSFSKNNNYLEFQFANYWGKEIEISYLIEPKYKGEFLDPGVEVFMMFNDDMYGRSKNRMIKVK